MKTLLALLTLAALPVSLVAGDSSQKEVTLEGTGMCAKCSLKEAKSCTNALQVEDAEGNHTTYLFTENMKHDDYFCQGKTEGLVVKGIVTEKDGKLMLKPISIEKKDS